MNRRSWLVVLCSSCAVALACAGAPTRPDGPLIDEVTLEGAKQLPADKTKEKILTTESSWVPWWTPFIGHDEYFDETAWQADLHRISRFYEANGYYQVRILDDAVMTPKPGHVKLLVKLREGEPARVTSLEVRGLEGLPEPVRAPVLASLPLHLGDIFLEDTWKLAKGLLGARLREAGYAEVVVTGEAVVDVEGASVSLTLEVSTGPFYRFGKLFAQNLGGAIPGKYLRDEAIDEVQAGTPYSESAIARAQERVFRLGVFSAAKVTRGAPERGAYDPGPERGVFTEQTKTALEAFQRAANLPVSGVADEETWARLMKYEREGGVIGPVLKLGDGEASPEQRAAVTRLQLLLSSVDSMIPVVIDVREAPFRSVRAGVGGSADVIRNELHVVFEFTHRNLGFSRRVSPGALLDRLTTKVNLGVAFLPNLPSVISSLIRKEPAKFGPVGRASAQYEVPHAFGLKSTTFNAGLDLTRALDSAFDYYGGSLTAGFGITPTPSLVIRPQLELDAYMLNTPVSAGSGAATAVIGCPTFPRICMVSYLEVLVEYDRRDNRLEPLEGVYASARVAGGVSQANSFSPFFKLVPEVRGYWSPKVFHRRFTISGKLRAGTLLAPGNDAPIVVRFFSGGSNMRGFNQRRLSPYVVVPDAQDGYTVPIGGSGLLEASLELRLALNDDFTVALFSDNGMVTIQPLGVGNLAQRLYSAVGLGVRYMTVLGPIRFDLAYRLPFVGGPLEQFGESTGTPFVSQSGCFGAFNRTPDAAPTPASFGGAPEDGCTFHLSIGEAF